MKILPTGDLGVIPNEGITVRVTKSQLPYIASFPTSIGGGAWKTIDRPDPLTEVRTFDAPATVGAEVTLTVVFDFAPDAQGGFEATDNYQISITGNPTGQTRRSTIVPPPIGSRSF